MSGGSRMSGGSHLSGGSPTGGSPGSCTPPESPPGGSGVHSTTLRKAWDTAGAKSRRRSHVSALWSFQIYEALYLLWLAAFLSLNRLRVLHTEAHTDAL